MKIRGERECSSCGARWSYYETGSVVCPDCGSLRSVGIGDRAEHTAGPARLDLGTVVDRVDDDPIDVVAESAVERVREYLRTAGFVHAGELLPLSDTYLVAADLKRAGATLARAMRVRDEEELYFLSLLRAGVDGERPPPGDVPESLRAERGLAVAATAEAYVSDIRRLHDDPGPEVAAVLSAVRARRKRIEALDGDVPPDEAEVVVRTLRDLGTYLREGDEDALARAGTRLE